MQAFVRMYEPHEAREDTVVYPAFRAVVSATEIAELGQRFERAGEGAVRPRRVRRMVSRVA